MLEGYFVPVDFGDSISFHINSTRKRPDSVRDDGSLPPQTNRTTDSSSKVSLNSKNFLTGSAFAMFEEVSERGNPENNLLFKILSHFDLPFTLEIDLEKHIPPGAGLGGGSSNAGLLLQFLASMGIQADRNGRSLYEVAAASGADIPFFLNISPAYVSGIGEMIHPVDMADLSGILCLGNIHISTAEAYGMLKRPLQAEGDSKSLFSPDKKILKALQDGQVNDLGSLHNDFEDVVFRQYPELAGVKEAFYDSGASFASMSGSGSAIFGLYQKGMSTKALSVLQERFMDFRFIPFHYNSEYWAVAKW